MDELKQAYRQAFDPLGPSPEVRARILHMREQPAGRRRYVRRLSGVLAAAVLALALLGCAVAGTVYGDSIQGWFEHYWQAVNGRPMSQGQAALLDHLSQDIGLSRTVDGVTVTVDSAAVGDDVFFLLLRVEGLEFSKRFAYRFEELELAVQPDPVGRGDLGGYGFQYQGMDGDGAALMLMDMSFASASGFVADSGPLEVKLTMEDLVQTGANTQKTLAAGRWEFSFSLDRSQIQPPRMIGEAEVFVSERGSGARRPVLVTDLELSSTGLRFRYRPEGDDFDEHPRAVLTDGTEVGVGGGYGAVMEDGETLSYSYQWAVPLDLEEVVAIQLGATAIPVQ